MKKKLFALGMATAIAITGAASVSADDEWMQETEMSGLYEIATFVTWSETYDSLNQIMNSSDICLIGTVIDQSIEERSGVYFTHSYVETEDEQIYDVMQTGAVVNGKDSNIPFDAPLMEIGEDYFLCLNEANYVSKFGQYYLIAGGNQGCGEYNESSNSVDSVNIGDRALFSSFTFASTNTDVNNITYDSVSNVQEASTRLINPLPVGNSVWDIWEGDGATYYVTDESHPSSSSRVTAIENGLASWNRAYTTSNNQRLTVSKASSKSRANVQVVVSDISGVDWIGQAVLYGSGKTYSVQIGTENATYYVIDSVGITITPYSLPAAPDSFWRSVAAHEMGHGVGLPHNDRSGRIMQTNHADFDAYSGPTSLDKNDLATMYDAVDSLF